MRSLFLGVVAGTEQPLERGKRRVTIASAPETALSGKQIHTFITAVDSAQAFGIYFHFALANVGELVNNGWPGQRFRGQTLLRMLKPESHQCLHVHTHLLRSKLGNACLMLQRRHWPLRHRLQRLLHRSGWVLWTRHQYQRSQLRMRQQLCKITDTIRILATERDLSITESSLMAICYFTGRRRLRGHVCSVAHMQAPQRRTEQCRAPTCTQHAAARPDPDSVVCTFLPSFACKVSPRGTQHRAQDVHACLPQAITV